ncbi:MAG: hypothetical protein P4M11_10250, partial [Candidatus Pacebacteria bacterium]|nr:hypothetical protein [Candidatus Paceibacterota bacterium]
VCPDADMVKYIKDWYQATWTAYSSREHCLWWLRRLADPSSNPKYGSKDPPFRALLAEIHRQKEKINQSRIDRIKLYTEYVPCPCPCDFRGSEVKRLREYLETLDPPRMDMTASGSAAAAPAMAMGLETNGLTVMSYTETVKSLAREWKQILLEQIEGLKHMPGHGKLRTQVTDEVRKGWRDLIEPSPEFRIFSNKKKSRGQAGKPKAIAHAVMVAPAYSQLPLSVPCCYPETQQWLKSLDPFIGSILFPPHRYLDTDLRPDAIQNFDIDVPEVSSLRSRAPRCLQLPLPSVLLSLAPSSLSLL